MRGGGEDGEDEAVDRCEQHRRRRLWSVYLIGAAAIDARAALRRHLADALGAAGMRTASAIAREKQIASAHNRQRDCHQKRHKGPRAHHGESYGMSVIRTILLLSFFALAAWAQEPGDFLMQQAGGTNANPAAQHEHMMLMEGSWHLMLHGLASFNDLRATGPRGGEKEFSTNWMMVSAQRPLGGGHLLLRTMLSLEPATISGRKYPELFQTGETAFGKQLIDGQHPHDL